MSFPLVARQNRADLEPINLAAKMHDYGTEVAHKSWMQVAHTRRRRFRSAWSWKSKLSIRFAYFRTTRPPSWSLVSYGYRIELARQRWSFAIIYCWSGWELDLCGLGLTCFAERGTYDHYARYRTRKLPHRAHELPRNHLPGAGKIRKDQLNMCNLISLNGQCSSGWLVVYCMDLPEHNNSYKLRLKSWKPSAMYGFTKWFIDTDHVSNFLTVIQP